MTTFDKLRPQVAISNQGSAGSLVRLRGWFGVFRSVVSFDEPLMPNVVRVGKRWRYGVISQNRDKVYYLQWRWFRWVKDGCWIAPSPIKMGALWTIVLENGGIYFVPDDGPEPL